jgi:hypothetical protein
MSRPMTSDGPDQLVQRLDRRFDELERRLVEAFRNDLHAALTAQTRQLVITWTTLIVVLSALAFSAGRMR